MDKVGANNPAVFTPEAVAAINRAYTEACAILADEGAREDLRLELAECLMHLARMGEIDEGRLCALSVQRVLGRKPRGRDTRAAAYPTRAAGVRFRPVGRGHPAGPAPIPQNTR